MSFYFLSQVCVETLLYWRFRGRFSRVQMYLKMVPLHTQFELNIFQLSVKNRDKSIDVCSYIGFEICSL